jgi:phosphatidylethanolamine N-methyltransferase
MPNQDLPLEYNTWLLFRQVVDIILLNDFLSYVIFALCNLDILFPASGVYSFTSHNPGTLVLRLLGGVALLLFNLWVKTSAHDVVKDYGWYWGDCFFSRGYLRKTRPATTLLTHEENGSASNGTAAPAHEQQEESTDLQFDLTFDGIFEMAPHPMYSVGYAGYYGVSLLASSYPVFFVSLAAHAAQFAFLNFFENPHIERRYGVRKALADRTNAVVPTIGSPIVRKANIEQENTSRARSVSLGTTTAIDSEDGDAHEYPMLNGNGNGHHWNGVKGGMLNHADAEIVASITPPNGADEVAREAVSQHDMLNKFFRKDVIVFSDLDLLR